MKRQDIITILRLVEPPQAETELTKIEIITNGPEAIMIKVSFFFDKKESQIVYNWFMRNPNTNDLSGHTIIEHGKQLNAYGVEYECCEAKYELKYRGD